MSPFLTGSDTSVLLGLSLLTQLGGNRKKQLFPPRFTHSLPKHPGHCYLLPIHQLQSSMPRAPAETASHPLQLRKPICFSFLQPSHLGHFTTNLFVQRHAAVYCPRVRGYWLLNHSNPILNQLVSFQRPQAGGIHQGLLHKAR